MSSMAQSLIFVGILLLIFAGIGVAVVYGLRAIRKLLFGKESSNNYSHNENYWTHSNQNMPQGNFYQNQSVRTNYQPMIFCPACRSNNVSVQVVQENQGSVTNTKTNATYKRKGHGFLWWLFIGWWWWIVDLLMWVYFFWLRLIVAIVKLRKYTKTETSTSFTNNNITYRKICTCQNCGKAWIMNL